MSRTIKNVKRCAKALPIFLVKRKSPAFGVMKRIAKDYRPGMILAVTDEEYESLKDLLIIHVEE